MAKPDVLDARVDLNYFNEQFRSRIKGILNNPTRFGRFTKFYSNGEVIETNADLLRMVQDYQLPPSSGEVVHENLVNRLKKIPSIGPKFAGFFASYIMDRGLLKRIPQYE